MIKNFIGLFVVALSVITPVKIVHCQSSDVRVEQTAMYGTSNGLLVKCIDEVYQDHLGRLWLTPCANIGKELGINTFQFDGEKSIFHEMPSRDSTNESPFNWKIKGQTVERVFYGVDYDFSQIFLWDMELSKVRFFKVPREQLILQIIPHPETGILVLFRSPDFYRLVHLRNEGHFEITKIAKTNPFQELSHFSSSLELVGEEVFFLVDRLGYAQTNWKTKKNNVHYWKDELESTVLLHDTDDVFNHNFEWKVFGCSDERILFYLGYKNGFFSKDIHLKRVTAELHLNGQVIKNLGGEKFLRVFFAQDKFKRILVYATRLYPTQKEIAPIDNELILVCGLDSMKNLQKLVGYNGVVSSNLHFQTAFKFFGQDFQKGINWIAPDGLVFCKLKEDFGISSFTFNTGIRAIGELNEKELFVNNDILPFKLNMESNERSYLKPTDIHDNGLTPYVDFDGKIWGSLEEGGVFSLDKATLEYEIFECNQVFDKFDFLNNDTLIFFTRDGQLFSSGLNQFEATPMENGGNKISTGSFVNEFKIIDEKVFAATRNGLWIIYLQEKGIVHYPSLGKMENINLLSITQSKSNPKEVWMGSVNNGVIVFNIKSEEVKSISTKQQLSNNTVIGIIEDPFKNKWVSTFHGINVIDSNDKVIYNLERRDGLSDDEYNRMSYTELKDGRYVFGSINGLDVINPVKAIEIIRNRPEINLYLNSVSFFNSDSNEMVTHASDSSQIKPINIHPENRFLNVDFALSEYVDRNSQTFQYRLVPMEEKDSDNVVWIDLGSISRLQLSNIPVGNFNLEIRGANRNKIAAVNTISIPLLVSDFFYNSMEFYAIVALFIGLVIIFFYLRLLFEKRKLKVLVERRTERINQDKIQIEEQSKRIQYLYDVSTKMYLQFSHELKTPLTVIYGITDSIKGNQKVKDLIKRNAQSLTNLVQQIMELGRIESKEVSIEMIQGDVVLHVKRIMEALRPIARDKSIRLDLKNIPGKMVLDFDPERMRYILTNLLTNAVKYSPENSEVTISLGYEDDLKKMYQITVSDNGIGISKEDVPFIFDRFYRVKGDNMESIEGSGVGLSIVRELVELLNGSIHVQSALNEGTTFRILLPVLNQADLEISSNSEYHSFQGMDDETISTDKPSVLIIEDSKDVIEFLKYVLAPHFNCYISENGKDGIQKAFDLVPDIIISDLIMPLVKGTEVCEVIKNDIKTSHIPFILLSAKSDLNTRVYGLTKGADAYISKPFDQKELVALINSLLNSRREYHKRYQRILGLEEISRKNLSHEDDFIIKLRNIIEENIEDEDFGVSTLAERMLLSRSQIHNKIKALTNKSSSSFIKQIRIEKASEYLVATDFTISEVAFKVGISNPAYFSKMFAEQKKMSPREYRNSKVIQ